MQIDKDPNNFYYYLAKIIDICGEAGELQNFRYSGYNEPTELGYQITKAIIPHNIKVKEIKR